MSGELVPLEAEIVQLETEVADRGSSYWRGPQAPAKQSRYLELLRARESGAAPPKIDAKSQEMLALETKMADWSSDYWRGPTAEALQARYRALVSGGASPAATDSWRASPDAARATLPAALVVEWGQDLPANLARAQDRAALVAGALDGEARMASEGAFNGLFDGVQAAIYSELGRPSPGTVKPASDDDLNQFRAGVPAADTLIAEWGASARRNVGRVLDAVQRINGRLTDAEKNQFRFWWNACPVKERMMMARALAS